MQYANYSAFRLNVQRMIDGDDTASSTIDVASLDNFIALGESRILGDFRSSLMLKALNIIPVSGEAELPTDILELHTVRIGDKPAEIITYDRLMDIQRVGCPFPFAAQLGNKLVVHEDSGMVTGAYYAEPTPLKSSLHATFQRYPELYLYAALLEGSVQLGLPQFETFRLRYAEVLANAKTRERNMVYDGSPLRIRAR